MKVPYDALFDGVLGLSFAHSNNRPCSVRHLMLMEDLPRTDAGKQTTAASDTSNQDVCASCRILGVHTQHELRLVRKPRILR